MNPKTVQMCKLAKPKKGDRVAVLSPSFAAPGRWPHVYELGLTRLREQFGLEPVEFPTTRKLGATTEERARDLVAAFANPDIKGVIATIGGDDQVTYVTRLPAEPFANNPKPFFGFSDNSHFANRLWLNGAPSYYGGSIFTEFAFQKKIPPLTERYLRAALFKSGMVKLEASETYNDVGLTWNDPAALEQERQFEPNDGWHWDGSANGEGVTWGGCLESVDEMLRHGVPIPSLEQFNSIVLMLETSEEIPSASYVARVLRALGERGILARVQGLLVGRPKAWEFDKPATAEEKAAYRMAQREAVAETFRRYNRDAPLVQNLDFGHTAPQIPMPYGLPARIDAQKNEIEVEF